jgi:hypothetical protein
MSESTAADKYERAGAVSGHVDSETLAAASRDDDPIVRLAAARSGVPGTGARAALDVDLVIRALADNDTSLPDAVRTDLVADPRVGKVLEIIRS